MAGTTAASGRLAGSVVKLRYREMKIAFVAQPFERMVPPVRTGSLALWIYYMAQQLVARGHGATIVGNNGSRLRSKSVEQDGVRYTLTPTLLDAQVNRIGRRLGRALGRDSSGGSGYVYADWHHAPFGYFAAGVAAAEHADVVHVMNYSQFVPTIRRRHPAAVIALHMQCEWLTQFPREVIEPRLRQADVIIGCSQYITDLIAAEFPEFSARCVTVPNSADHIPEDRTARPAGPKVLFVGRLSPEKGVHDLITAFRGVLARVPDATLHLVGAPGSAPLEYLVGPSKDPHVQALRVFYDAADRRIEKDFYLTALEELAGPELGRRIVFEGYADHHTIQAHYGNAAVLVNPSLSESFGITVVEAMMMKVPVIATRVGGMKHTVVPGETGFLVEPGNPSALGQAIEAVLTDRELASRMGAAGRARALEEFSWGGSAERLTEAYAQAVARR